MAILLVAMPERVTQKAEALLTRLLDAGLRLIQGDTHPCYHLPRPIQCLSRFAATENHEIIRIGDYMGVKLLSPFGVPPSLQQTIHIQVGQHGAGHSPYTKGNLVRRPEANHRLVVNLKEWGYCGES